jgi:hypothetical protein
MLRVVDAVRSPAASLRRIGLYGFEPELERYVMDTLRARWPRSSVTFATDPGELQRVRQQLWLCACAPPEATLAPVLWLDGVGVESAPTRLAPRLWRLSAPITAERLVHGIERVLAA